MIGTVTLNPSIDREILIKELIKDDAVRAISIRDTAGGKGVNVAKVVRELGGRTMAFAFCGGIEGQLYRQKIKTLDIPHRLVPVGGATRLNIILTDRDDATQTRVSAPGPQLSAAESRRLQSALCRFRPRPWVWVLGGTPPLHSPVRVYADLVRVLKRQTGASCVVDADGEVLHQALEAGLFMVKPNEFELQRLLGRTIRSTAGYARAAKELVSRGVRHAVVSLGAKGALFASENKCFLIPALPVKVRSKVGAGDSLIAGFLLGLERGHTLEDAARLGMAASHSAVMREPPRLCLRGDISGLFGRFQIRTAI